MTSPGPTALITGVRGFVGPHLRTHLQSEGDTVVGADVGSGPDLRDKDAWTDYLNQHQPDVIYHLAGWSDVGGSWNDPHSTFDVNVMGTLNLCEAARKANVQKLVFVSSAEVYGPVPTDELPIQEDRPMTPASPYGASKQAAEAIATHYWRSHNLDIVIARPFNHIGPGQSERFFAPAFAHQIAELERAGGGTLTHGNLSAERDLLDVRDVVRAYRLLAHQGTPGETYNICSGQARSIESVLEAMLTAATVKIETAIDPERLRPVDLPKQCGSNQKLLGQTSWSRQFPIAETVEAVLNDARQQRASKSAP